MARKSKGMGNMMWYALYAVGGYYAYSWWMNRQALPAPVNPLIVSATPPVSTPIAPPAGTQ